MGEMMNFPNTNTVKRMKSCVPERVSIFYPICGTHHDLLTSGNQSCVTLGEQTLQHDVTQICQICAQGIVQFL